MKVVNAKKIRGGYRHDFELFAQRRAPRGYSTRSASDKVERELRERLRNERDGVTAPTTKTTSARLANWGGVYMRYVMGQHALGNIKRRDAIKANVSSVLRFFGRRPTEPDAYVHPTAPYLDLTLADPIAIDAGRLLATKTSTWNLGTRTWFRRTNAPTPRSFCSPHLLGIRVRSQPRGSHSAKNSENGGETVTRRSATRAANERGQAL
jgi:hypothetical protein